MCLRQSDVRFERFDKAKKVAEKHPGHTTKLRLMLVTQNAGNRVRLAKAPIDPIVCQHVLFSHVMTVATSSLVGRPQLFLSNNSEQQMVAARLIHGLAARHLDE